MLDWCTKQYPQAEGYAVEDDDAKNLSHVGTAAYESLRSKHGGQHHSLWNVTSGKVVGQIHQTPAVNYWSKNSDPDSGHSDWFPEKMAEIMSRTERWCDVMSLGPPDGIFMEKFQDALAVIATRSMKTKDASKCITIRMMFGNIVGMPVNCNALIKEMTSKIPADATSNIRLWVGAWRKGVSWNHAKIIAVDGRYLHTGGHNMWDKHYCKHNPVHDLSIELEGRVAHDGHLFANDQWQFIQSNQETCCGTMVDQIPDYMPVVARTRVTVSEFPRGKASEFPPMYQKRFVPETKQGSKDAAEVPMLTMGRYGSVLSYYRPSDDAFLAMMDSAKKIIRMGLQDLGPVRIPKTNITVPGCVWPHEYLAAMARAIWSRGVDVEIVLSNPCSIPGGLSPTEANYGNGWSCVEVAAEIIKAIRKQFPDASNEQLRKKVQDNLRICYIRRKPGNKYANGGTVGMHAKHFIIDDVCTYIGSQNLYICDLAEWGVVIDHEGQVKQIMKEYWKPMWEWSYTGKDVDVQEVMDGLDIDRDGEVTYYSYPSTEGWKQQQRAAVLQAGLGEKFDKDLDLEETTNTEVED